jgi:hypothetical protein
MATTTTPQGYATHASSFTSTRTLAGPLSFHRSSSGGTGTGQDLGLCALDLLASANLLNHFGQVEDVSNFTVTPVCLQKGASSFSSPPFAAG